MSEDTNAHELIPVSLIAVGIAITLMTVLLLLREWTKPREGETVFPAGNTYLGPIPQTDDTSKESIQPKTFTITEETPWKTIQGRVYGYTFQAPETLTLTTFPNDPYDIYAITWNKVDPGSNVLIGVDNLTEDEKKKPYVGKTLKDYIDFWWTQFPSLSGIAVMQELTTTSDMKGYIVKYKTKDGQSPYDDVFLSVPGDNTLVIHMANQILPKEVFEKIVESVEWKSQ